jgi:hypothetical protein
MPSLDLDLLIEIKTKILQLIQEEKMDDQNKNIKIYFIMVYFIFQMLYFLFVL